MAIQEQKEEYIENDILDWLHSIGGSADKIVSEGFYDVNKGIYRQRKSHYVRPGISDIIGTLPNGRYIAIEVKKPSEMSFFDRPIEDLVAREKEQLIKVARNEVKGASVKKYSHAVEQRSFLLDKIARGGVGFFASSVDDCIKALSIFGIEIQ